MDTFMCSSWYHYAYVTPYWQKGFQTIHEDDMPWNEEQGDYWLPVDQYTGGIEHATMHLLYTRFFTKALHKLEVVPFDEPMQRLFNQGMILGPDGEKMSKSRGNVVNPDDGDATAPTPARSYFDVHRPAGPRRPCDPAAIEGVSRFMYRVWSVALDDTAPDPVAAEPAADDVRNLERKLHQTIIKVTDDFANFRFNTAIAALMELNNNADQGQGDGRGRHARVDEAIDALGADDGAHLPPHQRGTVALAATRIASICSAGPWPTRKRPRKTKSPSSSR
ncbi:MAG: class I tRNA ligase family protein [Caldilineaceae bacterium]